MIMQLPGPKLIWYNGILDDMRDMDTNFRSTDCFRGETWHVGKDHAPGISWFKQSTSSHREWQRHILVSEYLWVHTSTKCLMWKDLKGFFKDTMNKYREYENIILFEPLKLSQVRIEMLKKTVNKGLQESLAKSFMTYKLKTPALRS